MYRIAAWCQVRKTAQETKNYVTKKTGVADRRPFSMLVVSIRSLVAQYELIRISPTWRTVRRNRGDPSTDDADEKDESEISSPSSSAASCSLRFKS